ncbi:hypothetical protein M8756_17015 [Lutimaribacter sp. EGI FJ00015]|uniref:Uncharacterized protein n=1 Tax=Lutimaribacter degradans TaxID=2945989 RepID=A0ACC6A071_9RHOB|nr:hypothetical protein [Lutimaribacter sp. EGI FJ00013]MCM2563830.1 hypothetical protein [Lutimaribacter sp. EGI FJ00013]MCO0615015.1 hypothetical protein [Lutimaribacter sp. EGI FJ00015]MCO0637679.1 hypothetical protein [Lutimaribacter sp. EGI FJ00014]
MMFAHCDDHGAALADALHVSESLNGRVVIPVSDRERGTVVVMHQSDAEKAPEITYDHTDDGHLCLCLRGGEVVLQGLSDPSQVCMVLATQ